MTDAVAAVDGLLVVDKPPGLTSHDVVARVRRAAGTRRVGHAGTLDPMATGVLIVGVGRATRLLGHLAGSDKAYDATVRLGMATTTDDAEGQPVGGADASGVTDAAIAAAMLALTGSLEQVPASVSAVKVGGRRAYDRVRSGESVALAPRPVHVEQFELRQRRGIDLDVHVVCSTGTYVRALARDLGAALGVGAHLTALRRTRVGDFGLAEAVRLDELPTPPRLLAMGDVARRAFATWAPSEDDVRRLALGQRLAPAGLPPGPVAVLAPDGSLVALVEERDDAVRPAVVFSPLQP